MFDKLNAGAVNEDALQNTADAVRARDLGITLDGTPGQWNAITDVPGVEVGLVTVIEGDGTAENPVVRSGVTAILPRGREGAATPCAAGTAILNGNGELTGRAWIEESGQLQAPIAITNSHAVGAVHRGVDLWMAKQQPFAAAAWMLPVVGETWDGYLNSINADRITSEHAEQALDAAATGPVAEGNVGGGTGMNCYGFKGGTGTASRVVAAGDKQWTVGVLLQANFGSREELRVVGRPLGRESAAACPMATSGWFAAESGAAPIPARGGAGSVIVVVATDAPLSAQQCQALARRVPLGLARTGTAGSHFSGDIFLAFSTANEGALRSSMAVGAGATETMEMVSWGAIDPLYTAVVEATEEAVLNALAAARDMVGRNGHESFSLPHAEVRAAFGAAG